MTSDVDFWSARLQAALNQLEADLDTLRRHLAEGSYWQARWTSERCRTHADQLRETAMQLELAHANLGVVS